MTHADKILARLKESPADLDQLFDVCFDYYDPPLTADEIIKEAICRLRKKGVKITTHKAKSYGRTVYSLNDEPVLVGLKKMIVDRLKKSSCTMEQLIITCYDERPLWANNVMKVMIHKLRKLDYNIKYKNGMYSLVV